MAQKDYTKGMAQLAARVDRYITRYNLANVASINGTTWTSTLQSAAASMLAAAQTIDGAIPFREQP